MSLEDCLAAAFTPERITSNEIQQHEWELRTLLDLVASELKPDFTVELGTYKGWAAAALSWVSQRTLSIDIKDYGTENSAPFSRNLVTAIADATDGNCLPPVPIDLLFIDDGHYYETICKEFELWKPHVRPGGWIVFHDINPLANIGPNGTQPDCIQVPRFWKELGGNKQEIIAGHEHSKWRGHLPHGGLGILRL